MIGNNDKTGVYQLQHDSVDVVLFFAGCVFNKSAKIKCKRLRFRICGLLGIIGRFVGKWKSENAGLFLNVFLFFISPKRTPFRSHFLSNHSLSSDIASLFSDMVVIHGFIAWIYIKNVK